MDRVSERKVLHLVSFNVPYPPDYGGVMDVFYKITSLRKLGADVILHCFGYGRGRSRILEHECLRVHYYRRELNLFHIFSKDPFVVVSRRDDSLLANLLKDTSPILFEGLHTTYYLDHPALAGRVRMVRTHNIEHIYYRNLAASDRNPFRKWYFNLEADKLERYEPVLAGASLLLCISPGDTEYFNARYGNACFVGPFHPAISSLSRTGMGSYVLLHGDFSTAENNAAALVLVRDVVSKWQHHTILAGKRPSPELTRAASAAGNVTLISDPSQEQMIDLIAGSQVCLLNGSQPSGMKLKLINALCGGRHVITSEAVTSGSGLADQCFRAAVAEEWITLTDRLMKEEFTPAMREARIAATGRVADNMVNARRIIDCL